MGETVTIEALRARLEELQRCVEKEKKKIEDEKRAFKQAKVSYKTKMKFNKEFLLIAQGKVEAIEWLIYDMEAYKVIADHAY